MLLFVLLACSPPPPAATRLTIAGSSTIQPVAERYAQAWHELHPEVTVDVQGGGSSVGISSPRTGLADIGAVSRKLKPEEADLVATKIGLDGIALIVNAKNPLSTITTAQVADVYAGRSTSWAAFGGEDHPITVVIKEEGRSTRELFDKQFGLKEMLSTAVSIGPNGQAIRTVAGDPYAVAYVSVGSATAEEAAGTAIRRLSLDGIAATVEDVSNGTYPLMRELNLVTHGPPTPAVRDFLDFCVSPAGQKLVVAEDFVPIGPAL